MASKKHQNSTSAKEKGKSETQLILPGEVSVSNHRGDILTDYRDSILSLHLQVVSAVIDALQRAIVCGSYFLDVKALLPHGALAKWRQENFGETSGLSERTMQRYMKTASKFAKFLTTRGQSTFEECRENPRLLLEYVQAFHDENSAASQVEKGEPTDPNDWQTPEYVIAAARQLLSSIECDPCASTHGAPIADVHYTKVEDGLSQPWPGTAWVAPGHTGINFSEWCKKALNELNAGNLSEAILCLPESELRLVPKMYRYPIAISYLPLTVSYASDSKTLPKTLPTCSTFVYLSSAPRTEQFATAFREIAAVFEPVLPESK